MVRDEPCRLPVRLARNERLEAAIKPELMLASLDSIWSGRPARRFRDFMWSTIDSWSRNRRVVGKAEVTGGDANPRFVVTSLKSAEIAAQHLYEAILSRALALRRRDLWHHPPQAAEDRRTGAYQCAASR